MSLLERAIEIAVTAHKDQVDKASKPYILHPLRLMFKMQTENEMIAAVLHDVVEDMDWTIEKLVVEGFDEEVITAVKLLTHNKKVLYKKYIEAIKTNKIALKVKLADLEDNMDIKRIAHPKFRDYARLAEYLKYYNELKKLV
ncbi:MAG: HD domain-containing protein [Ignavibacteriales bacterium]|nr:HD domain-containing protein [Ignavibacteriales bacterium]MBP9120635.1 HD domain-containing protein [Ignavibacterium sp.]